MASWCRTIAEKPEPKEVGRGVPSTCAPVDVTPSARRLTSSLRDIGYDFASAVADLVDNSISAGASTDRPRHSFHGASRTSCSPMTVEGMSESTLNEALRLGSRRDYDDNDLGHFGLGLKTASLSQSRRLTVSSRRSTVYRRISTRVLDLDALERDDRWEITDGRDRRAAELALEWLSDRPGTVVCWEHLDRVLPESSPDGGWARRRLDQLATRAADYLGMVFHRFIEGDGDLPTVTITINGEKVEAWDPFASSEEARIVLPMKIFEVEAGGVAGAVLFRPVVLPARDQFSTPSEFDRLRGPLRWNRQQGLYIYRSGRLIQAGGWCGIRAADEHTKLARAAVDFHTRLDSAFRVNVAKMRVALPAELRTVIARPIQELCHRAQATYRGHGPAHAEPPPVRQGKVDGAGLALRAAAVELGELEALKRIAERVRLRRPEIADALGM